MAQSGFARHQGHGLGGDAFSPPWEPEFFGRGSLDADLTDLDAQGLRDVGAHRFDMRTDAGTLANHRTLDIADFVTRFADDFPHTLQQLQGVGTFPSFVGVGEVHADVARADRTEKRIGDRVEKDIGIGMAEEPFFMRDVDTPEDALAAIDELVDIEALTDAEWNVHASKIRNGLRRSSLWE